MKFEKTGRQEEPSGFVIRKNRTSTMEGFYIKGYRLSSLASQSHLKNNISQIQKERKLNGGIKDIAEYRSVQKYRVNIIMVGSTAKIGRE
jgi:hypothetical protein